MPNETGCGRSRHGADRAELTEVIARRHARMVAVAARMLHDDDEARDAVQDAYLQAVRHLHRFGRRARLSTWLHRIVVNTALMRLRTRRRHPVEPLDPATLPAEAAGPESTIHARQVQAIVWRSLRDLRPNDRLVLVMRDIAERDPADIARTLRVTRGGLKVRAYRARQALRARIVELGVTSAGGTARVAETPGGCAAGRRWPVREAS